MDKPRYRNQNSSKHLVSNCDASLGQQLIDGPSESASMLQAHFTTVSKVADHYHRQRVQARVRLVAAFLAISSLLLVSLERVQSLVDCDFERHRNGCFSQANFECDMESFKCVCQALTPVLIDDHLCVKRAKGYEPCQYSAQCDNERGFYCYSRSLSSSSATSIPELVRCGPTESRCRCLNDHEFMESLDGSQQQQLALAGQGKQRAHRPNLVIRQEGANTAAHNTHYRHSKSAQHQHFHHDQVDKQNNLAPHSWASTTSILSRFVWIFLVLILFGLITLLVLIKYQSSRTIDRPFHRSEDRVSISSGPDLPPPYEVAIRMKV